MIPPGVEVDLAARVGDQGTLTVQVDGERTRSFHGVVADVRSWDRGAR